MEYSSREWYKFVLVLLNPDGNENRNDLTKAALDKGEKMEIDFGDLYEHAGVPVKITITVIRRTDDYAEVHITREIKRFP